MRFYPIAISFFIFTLTGLFYAWNALPYPMVYDDLHLIRSYTREELVHSFYGPFDADNIETVGLRPLTMLFNDIRYELLGENVVAQRLLLIILFSVFFVTIVIISSKLGTLSWEWATLAGVLGIGAKYNVIHYVWLADGIHLLQGIFFGFSLLMLLNALDKQSIWMYAGSLVLAGLNLLVREDTLATFPALFFLGGYFVRTFKPQAKKGFVVYFLALMIFCIVFMLYRAIILPNTQSIVGNFFGFFQHIIYMLALPGVSHFNNLSMSFVYLWGASIIGVFIFYFIGIRNSTSWKAGVWLISGILACLPGISVSRVNLVLFPIVFFTVFLCSVLQSLATRSYITKMVSIGILVIAIGSELYITPIITQSFHPYSSTAMVWNAEFLYGPPSQQATIPIQRRREILQQLTNIGIDSYGDGRFKNIISIAIKKGRRFPNGKTVFVPYLEALRP
jgi:hypothetical protein